MNFNSKKAGRKISSIKNLQRVALPKKQMRNVKGGGGETVEIIIQEEISA